MACSAKAPVPVEQATRLDDLFALHPALASQFPQALFQEFDAIAEQAAVGFQLLFTRTAHADTAALPLKVGPATHQAGG